MQGKDEGESRLGLSSLVKRPVEVLNLGAASV